MSSDFWTNQTFCSLYNVIDGRNTNYQKYVSFFVRFLSFGYTWYLCNTSNKPNWTEHCWQPPAQSNRPWFQQLFVTDFRNVPSGIPESVLVVGILSKPTSALSNPFSWACMSNEEYWTQDSLSGANGVRDCDYFMPDITVSCQDRITRRFDKLCGSIVNLCDISCLVLMFTILRGHESIHNVVKSTKLALAIPLKVA